MCCLLRFCIRIRLRKGKSVYNVLLLHGKFFHLFSYLASFCAAVKIIVFDKGTTYGGIVPRQRSGTTPAGTIYNEDKAVGRKSIMFCYGLNNKVPLLRFTGYNCLW